jgi:hypothetical protein
MIASRIRICWRTTRARRDQHRARRRRVSVRRVGEPVSSIGRGHRGMRARTRASRITRAIADQARRSCTAATSIITSRPERWPTAWRALRLRCGLLLQLRDRSERSRDQARAQARVGAKGETSARRSCRMHGSFHGRTLGALAATDNPAHTRKASSRCRRASRSPRSTTSTRSKGDRRAHRGVFIVEPVQGESGVVPATQGVSSRRAPLLRRARRAADLR